MAQNFHGPEYRLKALVPLDDIVWPRSDPLNEIRIVRFGTGLSDIHRRPLACSLDVDETVVKGLQEPRTLELDLLQFVKVRVRLQTHVLYQIFRVRRRPRHSLRSNVQRIEMRPHQLGKAILVRAEPFHDGYPAAELKSAFAKSPLFMTMVCLHGLPVFYITGAFFVRCRTVTAFARPDVALRQELRYSPPKKSNGAPSLAVCAWTLPMMMW